MSATKPSSGSSNGNPMIDILSGTVGGIAQVFAGHPLDTIKVRLQTQVAGPDGRYPFKGTVDCAQKTFRQEGIQGLYKGAASPLLGAMAHNAGVFFSFGVAKSITGADQPNAPLHSFLLAGSLASVPIAIIESPVDLLKIKLQSQVGKGEFEGVFDAARKVFRRHGLAGLYQGFSGTLTRNIPCFGLYFLGSELGFRAVNPTNQSEESKNIFLGGLVGGACAGFLFWGILYPLETIKTRLQSDNIVREARKYSSYSDCVRKTYADGGVKAFYKGYVPSLARAIPVNAAIFCAVFQVKDFLRNTI